MAVSWELCKNGSVGRILPSAPARRNRPPVGGVSCLRKEIPMSERPLPRWLPPFVTAPAEAATAESRLLRRCLAAAVVIHGVLLALPVTWSVSKVAAAPPVVIPVHRLAQLRPPEPPEPPVNHPPPTPVTTTVTIPVPDFDPPEPLDRPEPRELPPPDLGPVDPGADLVAAVLDAPPPPPPEDPPIYVVGDVVPPEAIYAPEPRFPEIEQRIGRGGLVIVQAVIERDGSVSEVKVLRGASPALTEAALEAVRRWRFRPATRGDRPVAVYYQLTVRFQVLH